ncbi:MAG: hypothetical protein R3C25_06230 [Hyphomonadaceae bacterium]
MNDQGLDPEKANTADKEIQRVRDLLRDQTAETIDAFIAGESWFAQLTKLMLAAMLLAFLSRWTKRLWRTTNCPFVRGANAQLRSSAWRQAAAAVRTKLIHLLINIIRHGIDTKRIKSKVKIITFNYDLLLEHVLEEQFSNRETPLGPYTDYLDIMHVHGTLGSLTPTPPRSRAHRGGMG